MVSDVYVYDPTVRDTLSGARGIGRYLQILKENFDGEYRFVSELTGVAADSVFINPFLNLIQNPLITKRVAKLQIGVIHDLIPLKYPRRFPIGLRGRWTVYRNKRLLGLYDRIITDSEASKRDIVAILRVPADKITVIYPCLGAEFEKSADAPLPGTMPLRYFIYVGDVTWNKNIAVIARAVKKANASCVFVGKAFATLPKAGAGPWLKELRTFAKIVKGDKRFLFPGYVDNETLKSLYKHAVANILISHDEGYGFSYIEAASQKTPSLLADIPVFREIAGDTAVFADRQDVEGLARALSRLSDSPEQCIQLGKDAHTHVKKYSADQFRSAVRSVVATSS